jgi:H+/Cl- antiporter ClcA
MAGSAPAREGPLAPRALLALLVLTSVVGLVVSLASWGFLELIAQIQTAVFDDLPDALGYDGGAPVWWPLPVLALAGLLTALAIARLPGTGGHDPAGGLNAGTTDPVELPGVIAAAFATIGLGIVLGPEAPLLALGSGLGILAIRMVRKDAPQQLTALVGAAGSFAAVSFIFGSPLIGAVVLIEAAGLDKRGLQVVVPVGLLASGIGALVSTGIGSWDGLSSSDFALKPLQLPDFARPDLSDFAWTIPFAVAIAVVMFAIFALARALQPLVVRRALVMLPVAGLAVAGLAIAFAEATGEDVSYVLFSGQDSLGSLVEGAGGWSVGALALLIAFKALAWAISLSGFRGGPTFPGLLLGVAGGLLASHLPGFAMTPAVAVGMGAAMAAVLRLPLAGVVLATLLTSGAGAGTEPLIILGVVVAYLTSTALHRRLDGQEEEAQEGDSPAPPRAPGRTRPTSSATTVTR